MHFVLYILCVGCWFHLCYVPKNHVPKPNTTSLGCMAIKILFYSVLSTYGTRQQSRSTQRQYLSKSKDTSLENDFGKSESCLLKYNLSKSLKVAGINRT